VPPFYSRTTGLTGKVDRWQDIDYFPPGFYLLHARLAPIGQPPLPDGTDEHAFHMKIMYGLTPCTETSVYDFWALARDFCVGEEEVDEFLYRCRRPSCKKTSTRLIFFSVAHKRSRK